MRRNFLPSSRAALVSRGNIFLTTFMRSFWGYWTRKSNPIVSKMCRSSPTVKRDGASNIFAQNQHQHRDSTAPGLPVAYLVIWCFVVVRLPEIVRRAENLFRLLYGVFSFASDKQCRESNILVVVFV